MKFLSLIFIFVLAFSNCSSIDYACSSSFSSTCTSKPSHGTYRSFLPVPNWTTLFTSPIPAPILELIPFNSATPNLSQLIAVFRSCGVLGWNYNAIPNPYNVDWVQYEALKTSCQSFTDSINSAELVDGFIYVQVSQASIYKKAQSSNPTGEWALILKAEEGLKAQEFIGYQNINQVPMSYYLTETSFAEINLQTGELATTQVLSPPTNQRVLSSLDPIFNVFTLPQLDQLCIASSGSVHVCTIKPLSPYSPFQAAVHFRYKGEILFYIATSKGAVFQTSETLPQLVELRAEDQKDVFTLLLGTYIEKVDGFPTPLETLFLVRKDGSVASSDFTQKPQKWTEFKYNTPLQVGEQVSFAEFFWLLDDTVSKITTNGAIPTLVIGGNKGSIYANRNSGNTWDLLGSFPGGIMTSIVLESQGFNNLIIGLDSGDIRKLDNWPFAVPTNSRANSKISVEVKTKLNNDFKIEVQEDAGWCGVATARSVLLFYTNQQFASKQCDLQTSAIDQAGIDCCASKTGVCLDGITLEQVSKVLIENDVYPNQQVFDSKTPAPSFSRIQAEIINNRPIIIRIAPVQAPDNGHYIVIIGYQISSWQNTDLWPSVIFYDPDPQSQYTGKTVVPFASLFGSLTPYGGLNYYKWTEVLFTSNGLP